MTNFERIKLMSIEELARHNIECLNIDNDSDYIRCSNEDGYEEYYDALINEIKWLESETQ